MRIASFTGSKSLLDLSAILELSKRHTAIIRRYDCFSHLIGERYETLMACASSTSDECERLHRLRLRLARRRQRVLDKIIAEQNAWIAGDFLLRTMIEKGHSVRPEPTPPEVELEHLLPDYAMTQLLESRWPRNKPPLALAAA